MYEILVSIVSMMGLGIFFALVLAAADRTMGIKEDKDIADIEGLLPGLNCGACGYAGCHSFAVALSQKEAQVTGCLPGGEKIAEKLSELLGLKKQKGVKTTAVLHCNADFDQRKKTAVYRGVETCEAADKIFGGGLACSYGCLGYGDCAGVCPTGAIKMANGLPIVDPSKCISCMKCVNACPRGLYSVDSFVEGEIVTVACSSMDRGAKVREVCGVGCIACKICEKVSGGVFTVKDNLAKVYYDKARPDTQWDNTIKKCPTKVIVKIT